MNKIIKTWLIAGLIVGVSGTVLFSLVLIVRLGHIENIINKAEEMETLATKKSAELSALQVELDTLNKQKEILKPSISDWQQRLEEKSVAEAAVKSLEAKHKQIEVDIDDADKRLESTVRSLRAAEKQKTDIAASLENLKSELGVITKLNVDVKAMLTLAAEAERRLNDATNGFANIESRRKQSENDATSAQSRYDQLKSETDDLRQSRNSLNKEIAVHGLQLQSLKDQNATLDKQSAELKTRQIAGQQEDKRLAQIQQRIITSEAFKTELDARQMQVAAEVAQLTNRLELARSQVADWEAKRDAIQPTVAKATLDLNVAQKLFAETQASQDQSVRRQADLTAKIAALKLEADTALKDAASALVDFETTKSAALKSDADLAAVRKLTQELSSKQGDMTREVSRLETIVEELKKEKDSLEKEIGRLEAQRQKASAELKK